MPRAAARILVAPRNSATIRRRRHTHAVARIALAADSWLDFEPDWLSAGEAERALAAVRAEVTWAEREIVLYGKRIMQPRLVGWAGEVAYRYSGQTLEPRPFTNTVRALTDRVNEFARRAFQPRPPQSLSRRPRQHGDARG